MSFFARLLSWLKSLWGEGAVQGPDPPTEEFETLSSFTLLPGHVKVVPADGGLGWFVVHLDKNLRPYLHRAAPRNHKTIK